MERLCPLRMDLARAAAFAFTGALVVTWADAHSGRQAFRAAEAIHVRADFHQQHGGTQTPGVVEDNEARREGADVGLILPLDDEVEGGLATDAPERIIRRMGLAHDQHKALIWLIWVLMVGEAPRLTHATQTYKT